MFDIALFFALALPATTAQEVVASSGPLVPPTSASVAVSRDHDGSRDELFVPTPYVVEPGLELDGRLDETAWADAPVLRGFTQYEPLEGVPAEQETEIRLLVTEDAVHVAIRAFDTDPDGVRATLTDRDGFGRTDDYVRILLDTFDDQRRAYVFQVNPFGVQGDGLWVEGQGGYGDPIDWSLDLLWDSQGRRTPDGWVAELRIPFKSLRFPAAPLQDWGLQVTRTVRRSGFESSWAPIDGNQANRLAQMGRLQGLQDLDPGLFLEVNPVLTGTRVGQVDDDGTVFRRQSPTGDFGLNVTYGLTSNLTLDGTYNPDFSQVEADAGQITVNERFDVFLPERRPFFLEGADVFDMPQNLVYTRSVVQPVGATKLSGKMGETQIAYLGAVDAANPDVSATRPVVNLLRVKRDVGGSSTVGAVYTDRTRPGEAYNRVFGADGRFVLADRYTVEVMAAGSADGVTGEATDWGSLMSARFDRASRSLDLEASFEDVSEAFRARSGFIRRTGTSQARLETGWSFRGGRGAFVERVSPGLEVQGYWNRDDFWAGRGPEEAEVQADVRASFRGNLSAYVGWSRTAFSFDEAGYEGLFVGPGTEPLAVAQDRFGALDRLRFRGSVGTWEAVRFGFGGSVGEQPIFSRSAGVPLEVANAVGFEADVSLYPTTSLSAELAVRHERLTRQRDRSEYSSATIPRLETRYQFNRALFVRFIGEYASQERAPQLDPVDGRPLYACEADEGCELQSGSDAHDFSVEGLVGYEPSPGTVFFLGYTRQMEDPYGFRFRDLRTRADGLFVKLSYRFRM